MHDTDPTASPFNHVPWIVWAFALPMIAAEIVFSLGEAGMIGGPGAIGWRGMAVQDYSVFKAGMTYFWENRVWDELGKRLLGFSFIHYTLTQTLFAVVILLALGKMVAEIFRWWAVALVFLSAAVVGGIAYWLLIPDPRMGLVGGYPGVYGLIGAFTYLLWMQLIGTGGNQYRAFTLIGLLLGVQLLFGLLFGGGYDWIADIAGFAVGFGLSFFVSPGAFERLRAQLRSR